MKNMNTSLVMVVSLTTAFLSCKQTSEPTPAVKPTEITPAAESQPQASTGEGQIEIVVDYNGELPKESKNQALTMKECQAQDDKDSYKSVRINQGKLMNVFVHVKSGLPVKTYPAPTTPVVLDQKHCQYVPRVLGIQVGQPLELLNSDSSLHNVHSMAKNSPQFNVGMPNKGMKMTKTFSAPEIMATMKCDVHPWMRSYVGVLNHPFFGVSDESGRVSLKGVPAGQYVIEAWHEKFGTLEQQVTVTANQTAQLAVSFSDKK